MVLLVVDVQAGIVTPALYSFEAVRGNIQKLIGLARRSSVEVVYVRHDDGAGAVLSAGNDAFEIAADFAPQAGERIFDKTVNTAFRGVCGDTGLTEYLHAKGVRRVMVVGLQTEYCIDATIKSGFEHGFEMIVPEFANSTVDNSFMSGELSYHYYNSFIWPNRYALCVTMREAEEILSAEGELDGI
ncbi:MAG: cysteine hydrolase [Ruminococcaceae bacterium]|nr:cysteine hydrolase [Oscillospiraceae bacterium]